MVNWRAVGWGFVTFLVVAILGAGFPVVGQLGAGVVGGLVAGYLAGGSLLNGAIHGTIAGSINGVAFTVLFALFGGVIGFAAAGNPLGGVLAGTGVLVLGLLLTLVFAVESALAGAVGALVAE